MPAFGAGLVGLYRPYPYFSFGAGFSYSRANETYDGGLLDGELFSVGAFGRVYFYEEGVFDPYLELELGYGSLTTTFTSSDGGRSEDSAFGPLARVGGGLDFLVLPNLELGGSVGFTHLLLDRGEHCNIEVCEQGSAPGGAMLGALTVGLRATVALGASL